MQDWFVSIRIDYAVLIPTPAEKDENGFPIYDYSTPHGRLQSQMLREAKHSIVSALGRDGFYTKFVVAQTVSAPDAASAQTAAKANLLDAARKADVELIIVEERKPVLVELV